MDLDSFRRRHGGYWRDQVLDFHYLFNHHFPPRALFSEVREALVTLANSYPSSQEVLAELLAEWKAMPHAPAHHLVVGNGSSELIRLLMDRVVTRVTVPLPTFNEFTTSANGRVHHYALDEARGFEFDVARLLEEVDRSQSDYVALVNPNNPVGNLICLDDIRRILDRGCGVIVDEAFMPFAEPGASAEPLVPEYDNLVVVASLTKSIGIAGLRLGYALTASERVKRQLRATLPIWNVNAIAEYVLEALPRYRAEHAASLARIKDDTSWFVQQLRQIDGLTPLPTQSNAVLCRVRGSGRRLAEWLFDTHRFVVKDGISQAGYTSDASYVRLGVRNRVDNTRLLHALHAYDTSHTDERTSQHPSQPVAY
jgi:histidinol-phosphate/aromatic aminotransferase/cobyric acid decarboxylase-like protein